jgi:hypothetical protein
MGDYLRKLRASEAGKCEPSLRVAARHRLTGKFIQELGPTRILSILPLVAEIPAVRSCLVILARAAVFLREDLVYKIEFRTLNGVFVKGAI